MALRMRKISYEQRLSRVRDYIFDHLDEEIDLEKLAEIACLSPYHWHRTYQALSGETIAATVRRLRLQRAATYLAQTSLPLAIIAARSGYPNLQSFSRMFRSAFGMPPAAYRKEGSHNQFHLHLKQQKGRSRMPDTKNVKVVEIKSMMTAGLDHVGPYTDIGRAFEQLDALLRARAMMRPGMRLLGIYFDDSSVVPAAKLRSRACVVIPSDAAVAAPFIRTEIAGGSYARLRHKGPYADLAPAYQWLYGQWLATSGREVRNIPCFEEYLNTPQDTAPSELLTDVFMPLK